MVCFDFKKSKRAFIIVYKINFQGREKLMRELMKKINVDSYGGCLKNQFNHPSEHMKGNIELFSNYKFVIAIENSNCEDYVTEKLVHAIASGSIPIVAGKDNKPNYLKFLPKNSYINVYDYKSIDDLVSHLKKIASDRNEYEKYLYFKKNHNFTRKYLYSLPLKSLINLSKQIIEPSQLFFNELIEKEKSENKLCKIASFLKNNPENVIAEKIKSNRANRLNAVDACIESKNLAKNFEIND